MEVKWIKLNTNMFDNSKVKYIRTLPEGNNIVLIWVMLLAKAGKCNANGYIFLTENIPYTPDMLAAEFGFEVNIINLALISLSKLNMIQLEEQIISIQGWSEHQNIEGLDKIRTQTKERVAKHREKQKLLKESNVTHCNVTCNATVTQCNATDIDIEEDIEIDKDIDINNISKDILRSTFVQQIINKWNSLGLTSSLSKITKGTNRYKMLKARVNQFSEEEVLNAIDEINKSKFLKGMTNKFEVTFDWFIRPNNFLKIYEGNYRDKEAGNHGVGKSLSEQLAEDGIGFIIS